MLAPEGTAAGLSGILEDGKRALTVKVDEVAGVAGFLHPGDHVDVLVDLALKSEGQQDHFSKTILHDITILTTGQIWEQKGNEKPMVVNTVTLELTPENAEVLNLASNEGKIRLALRNRNNKTIAQTRGVTTENLIGGIADKKESKVAASRTGQRKESRGYQGFGTERGQALGVGALGRCRIKVICFQADSAIETAGGAPRTENHERHGKKMENGGGQVGSKPWQALPCGSIPDRLLPAGSGGATVGPGEEPGDQPEYSVSRWGAPRCCEHRSASPASR